MSFATKYCKIRIVDHVISNLSNRRKSSVTDDDATITSYYFFHYGSIKKPKNDPVYNFKASCTSLAEQISENRIIEAKSIEDLTNSLGKLSFGILQSNWGHMRTVLIFAPIRIILFPKRSKAECWPTYSISLERLKESEQVGCCVDWPVFKIIWMR